MSRLDDIEHKYSTGHLGAIGEEDIAWLIAQVKRLRMELAEAEDMLTELASVDSPEPVDAVADPAPQVRQPS
jgi:hypothetical protein